MTTTDAQARLGMTPDLSKEGEKAMTALKGSRWYRLLVSFFSSDRDHMPEAATEATQIEAAFFASYMDKRPG